MNDTLQFNMCNALHSAALIVELSCSVLSHG